MIKRYLPTLGAIAIIIGVGAILFLYIGPKNQLPEMLRSKPQPLIDETVLNQLPKKDASGIDTSHIASGVTPPANKWFSGFALQKDPKPGFALPNSYRPTGTGFELGLPDITTQPKTIQGGHKANVTTRITGATSYKITRYDELSVDVTYYDASNQEVAVATFLAGSPYVPLLAKQPVAIEVDMPRPLAVNQQIIGGGQEAWYGLRQEGANPTVNGETVKLRVESGKFATVYSAPTRDDLDAVAELALNRPMNTSVSYKTEGTSQQTTFSIQTANGQPTLFARMPHQQSVTETHTSSGNSKFTYPSMYGPLSVEKGMSFSYTSPNVEVRQELDIAKLGDDQKQELSKQLTKDIAATKLDSVDTYFGGKQLQRAAQLLTLAKQLDRKDEALALQKKLTEVLTSWFNPNSSTDRGFYYDTRIQGIVGKKAGFGANEFNDHHFHYGYILYAAAVVGRYDAEFVDTHRSMINLLVADIANYSADQQLPLRRHYDAYAGHSWASGAAPFEDGNNQESSSEAINAWTALGLWADVSNNAHLKDQSAWLLSNEMMTAKRYWLGVNASGYDYSVVGITWGGKRDYGTWFSAEPNTILAIQLLPMNPTMRGLATKKADAQIRELGEDPYQKQFGDYILMYNAPENALDIARSLPDEAIDDGNSRTYLLAWLMTK